MLGQVLKQNTVVWIGPLKILQNKLNMKSIGTKSINMSDIIVYFAIFSPHKMKMSYYFISLWYPLELGTFLISKDPTI